MDPNSMTLNDLIWQAHSHATAKEQEYQKALAEKKEREAADAEKKKQQAQNTACLLYTSPSPRDQRGSRMPSSA